LTTFFEVIGGWDYINNNNLAPGIKYINENGLNNLVNQYLINKKRLEESIEYYEFFCNKISEGLKRYYKNGGLNKFKNSKHTEESKKRIGEANSKNQKGNKNSQYGTCWVYNKELKENKKIKKEDLDSWLEQGWIKGRKIKI
jgi:hypothetical protein